MNKAIFMPGNLLQFRVFAVDSDTKAVTPTCANVISILDARRNAIMSFQNVTFKRGKYENSFKLSEKAGLGVWTFRFTCENEVSFDHQSILFIQLQTLISLEYPKSL